MAELATIVVTGASRGLGAFIASRAQEQGYHVLGLSRTGVSTESVTYDLRACDVSDFASVKATLSELKELPPLHGLINAAGIASMNLHLTTPAETMARVVGTNLLGTMYCCTVAGKRLARAGGGRIINFSSIAVAIGLKGESSYCASKAGVEGFSRSFAREMADFNVTVNTVAPGPVDTDLIRGVPDDKIDAVVQQQIIPRKAVLTELGSLIDFLLSDASSMVTGQVFNLGGV